MLAVMFDAGYQKGELMITRDDIVIRKAILHILDTDHGECILSSALLNPGPEMHDFIRNHIYKIISSDDTKNCVFDSEFSPIHSILETWEESNDASFIETSRIIANKLYAAMGEGLNIPAADLLFVTFQAEGTIYLALLKMNYKRNYNHASIRKGDYTYVELSRDYSLISATSRVPEAAIINLSDYSIKLLEKRYEVNGERVYYLSENFLVCHTSFSPKKKLNILTHIINNISNKYDGRDLKKKMDTRSALQKEYIERKTFNVEEIGNTLFGKNPEKKAEFDEKVEQYNLQYDNFTVVNENTVKKLEKQVLITDSGIEISIPMETYNKRADFEVKTDVTGKSTIVIGNIDNVILK